MWLLLAFLSAALLGFYDAFKKQALKDNAVLPVLFLNTVFSSLIFFPFILISAFTPAVLSGTMFDVPVYPEDSVPPGSSLPYITVKLVIPKGFDESSTFHARLWYPVDGGKLPLIRKADEIRAAIGDWLTIECEGGAILLCAGNPWAQPMGNPPEKYLCTYLIFDVTSFVV